MAITLGELEQRIVGVLVEKQMTTPDQYPLTMAALIAGCNQKSNRDPQIEVADWELDGAIRGLMDRGWVHRHERDVGRVMRYAHQAKEQLGVEPADLAVLSELLCRGPQTPPQLKTRCARMAHVGGPGDVLDRLHALATRPSPYVVELPKRPREKMKRWCHLLDGRTGDEVLNAAPAAPAEAHVPTAAPTPPAGPSAQRDTADPLVQRVDQLEAELAAIRQRLDQLGV